MVPVQPIPILRTVIVPNGAYQCPLGSDKTTPKLHILLVTPFPAPIFQFRLLSLQQIQAAGSETLISLLFLAGIYLLTPLSLLSLFRFDLFREHGISPLFLKFLTFLSPLCNSIPQSHRLQHGSQLLSSPKRFSSRVLARTWF